MFMFLLKHLKYLHDVEIYESSYSFVIFWEKSDDQRKSAKLAAYQLYANFLAPK